MTTPSHEHSHRQFAATRWSLVMRDDALSARDARGALIELCLRYWYPVYAYVRRCGHTPPIAQDITRSFLQHVFQHVREESAPNAHGQFRHYLLGRLHAFLADDWRKVSNDDVVTGLDIAPADLEQRNQRDNAGVASPEQAYQHSFALEVLTRAFARLREEARETGHLDMYDALEPFMEIDPASGEHEELARRLGTRPLALIVALKRLRQRFRELIGEELADTVASADELLAEQHALHAALRNRS
jgi:RNA polymerase sigma-70 factor (ECF subfamily)